MYRVPPWGYRNYGYGHYYNMQPHFRRNRYVHPYYPRNFRYDHPYHQTTYPNNQTGGFSNNQFILILVMYILLVIVGAVYSAAESE